jgi:hypothetical protein
MVDAYRLCTPAIRIAGGMGFGGWDLVEVVDLIGTIVGEICVTVGLGGGVFWGAVRVVPGNEVLAFPVLEFVGGGCS